MINILKIFTQASLMATAEDDSLLYTLISQSNTSPFMKKTKLATPNLNLGTLLIDISDGSKDNSSNNTPNFASPKSANTPKKEENVFGFNDDLDVVVKGSSSKLSKVSNIIIICRGKILLKSVHKWTISKNSSTRSSLMLAKRYCSK